MNTATGWCRRLVCRLVGHCLYWHPPLMPGYGQCATCKEIHPFVTGQE